MRLTFIGDMMLGRLVAHKYRQKPYNIVSDAIVNAIKDDFVVANLESPLMTENRSNKDHMCFSGESEILDQLQWINLFSTANNHINDFGDEGILTTLSELDKRNINHNGIYKGKYSPYIIEEANVAIITLTDLMNHEIPETSEYRLLRMDSEGTIECVKDYSNRGMFVIVFAHVGMLFTRYPNPITVDYLHRYVEAGANLIVTAHSHCLGGIEYYKGVPIVHSLGDFLMDGSSYRRRRAAYLTVDISNQRIVDLTLHPVETNTALTVDYPSGKVADEMLSSVAKVSTDMTRRMEDYSSFYRRQYNKEMISHSLSTVKYLYKTKGLKGLTKILFSRLDEVFSMAKWSVTDRSKVQSDTDALNVKNNISEEEFIDSLGGVEN